MRGLTWLVWWPTVIFREFNLSNLRNYEKHTLEYHKDSYRRHSLYDLLTVSRTCRTIKLQIKSYPGHPLISLGACFQAFRTAWPCNNESASRARHTDTLIGYGSSEAQLVESWSWIIQQRCQGQSWRDEEIPLLDNSRESWWCTASCQLSSARISFELFM